MVRVHQGALSLGVAPRGPGSHKSATPAELLGVSVTPIPGTTLRVSHCDDDDLVVRHAKDDPKRKSSQGTFSMERVYGVKLFWISLNVTK